MDWDDIRFFIELARSGSLSETARRLSADHSTVARRITNLEKALGLKLFDRLPRGYALTAEGERLAERAGLVEDAIFAVERLADGSPDAVEGRVRISAPPTFASLWLTPRLAPLLQRHPSLTLDVIGDIESASLSRREAELAIRLREPADVSLIARRIGELRYGLYGSRAYLEATEPQDHVFLGYDGQLGGVPQERWLRSHAGKRRFALETNDLVTLLTAARAGMGLAALPHAIVDGDDDLVCLEAPEEATRPLWLLVHPDLRRSQRIRTVMDHLVEITAPLRRTATS